MNAPFDVTGVRLETERLILRPWQEADLADFNEYAKVDGVGQMAGWKPHESMEESRKILQMFIDGKKTFAVVYKQTGKVIGSLGLELQHIELPEAYRSLAGREVGYVLSKDYWGQGLMPEAVKEVIRFCFHSLSYDILTCGHFVQNRQSMRVIEKCGFRFLMEADLETRLGTTEHIRFYLLENPNK